MSALKVKCRMVVKKVRLGCLMRNWNTRVKDTALLSAYGNHRLLSDEYKSHRFATMAAAYLLLNKTTNYVAISCFRKWTRYTRNLQLWKSFKFWHSQESAIYLLRTTFKAWYYSNPKRWKPVAKTLTLQGPHQFIDRSNEMLKNLQIGYDPSNSMKEEVSGAERGGGGCEKKKPLLS